MARSPLVRCLRGAPARALAALGLAAGLNSSRALAGPLEVLRFVAFHPNDPATYAVVYSEVGGGVLITRDGGKSFTLMCGAAATNVHSLDSLVPHALWTSDSRLLYGGFDGLFLSDPQGCSFERVEKLGSAHLRGLARDPDDPSILYGVTASSSGSSGLYISHDSGATWEALQESETAFFRSVVAQPGADGTTRLAASVADEVDGQLTFSYVESSDRGRTFASHALPDAAESTLLGFDARDLDIAYAAATHAGTGSTAILARAPESDGWKELLRVDELGTFEIDPTGGFTVVDSGSQKVLRVSADGSAAEELSRLAFASCFARQPGTDKAFVCRGHLLYEVIGDSLAETALLDLSSVKTLADCGTSPNVEALCADALAYGYCSPTHYPQAPLCGGFEQSTSVDAGTSDSREPMAGEALKTEAGGCAVRTVSPGVPGKSSLTSLIPLASVLALRLRRRRQRSGSG